MLTLRQAPGLWLCTHLPISSQHPGDHECGLSSMLLKPACGAMAHGPPAEAAAPAALPGPLQGEAQGALSTCPPHPHPPMAFLSRTARRPHHTVLPMNRTALGMAGIGGLRWGAGEGPRTPPWDQRVLRVCGGQS